MKKEILLTLLMMNSCNFATKINSNNEKNELTILAPTGAPSAAFLEYLNDDNFITNTVPNNIVAEMIKGSVDIAVVDLIGGLNAINNKNANYKLAATITFGNFYIYATGNDENKTMDNNDNIVGFGQNNTPDKLFNYLYPEISVDYYQPGVSDIAPIASSGLIEGEKVDYCIIAEPVLTKILSNDKAATYGKGYIYSDFQAEWKKIKGDNTSIIGASIFINNRTYNSKYIEINEFLNKLNNSINSYIENPNIAYDLLNNYGTTEEQAQRIGINDSLLKEVLMSSNSINLGYIDYKNNEYKNIIFEYLNIINKSLISDKYFLNEK